MGTGCIIHLCFPVWQSIFHQSLCHGAVPELSVKTATTKWWYSVTALAAAKTVNLYGTNAASVTLIHSVQSRNPIDKNRPEIQGTTNHNNSCSGFATIIPRCQSTPTSQTTLGTESFADSIFLSPEELLKQLICSSTWVCMENQSMQNNLSVFDVPVPANVTATYGVS